MIPCRDGDRLQDYLDGLLPESEHRALRTHLERCDACRSELALYERLLERLDAIPIRDPGVALTERILDRVVPSRVRARWTSAIGWSYTAVSSALTFVLISWMARPGTSAWLESRFADLYFQYTSEAIFTLHTLTAALLQVGDGWGLLGVIGERALPLVRAFALPLASPMVVGISSLAAVTAALLLAWLSPHSLTSRILRKGERNVEVVGF
ncbi:MAG: hypothetical protein HOP12_04345 [Candidatus Eisenbacteria bacterium]|uniref:Putative zinc-finger domain-containing protein n=1 Tax=Eiseniibacteriota bacterium TaxID=2212470 RepID=A0A849SIG2_UNCEI|nr:hypothetical protein [Candidatus Eisenbacteria bacterium]